MNEIVNYLLMMLAALYVAYVMTATDGLFGMFKWLRRVDPIGVTACMWCLVFWVAAVLFFLMRTDLVPLVHVLAIAGGAMAIAKYVGVK